MKKMGGGLGWEWQGRGKEIQLAYQGGNYEMEMVSRPLN